MSEEGVSKFMKEKKAEIFVRFEVKNGFRWAKEELAAGFEGKI